MDVEVDEDGVWVADGHPKVVRGTGIFGEVDNMSKEGA